MTERERLLAVLAGRTPDRVPWFGDLGYWYRAEAGVPWDLFSVSNCTPEIAALHRELAVGWYVEVGSLHEEWYDGGVVRDRHRDGDEAVETLHTPLGDLTMVRHWNPVSHSWDITHRMAQEPADLKILTYVAEHRHFRPRYENWQRIEAIGGDIGLGFPGLGYTALGSLMSYYMGVEATTYAYYDEPELFHRYSETVNGKFLELVDLYCAGPAPHVIYTDNLSGDVQPPDMFRDISFSCYAQTAARLHAVGKTVSAHLDGRLSQIIGVVAEAGIDVADACTPLPDGDLRPAEIRRQAGDRMILMGGVAATKWLPETSEQDFISHVREWLDLRLTNPRLIQSAGDQVPPGTSRQRIRLMAELVDEYGRYPEAGIPFR